MTDTTDAAAGTRDRGLRLRMRGEERRIASQHERLDDLCAEVYTQIEKEGPQAALNHFLIFMTALEAHMSVEEDIYFPALHGLCADAGPDLARLVADHDELRSVGARLEKLMASGDKDGSRLALDQYARHISAHELEEEDLLARITEGPVASGHTSLE